MAKYPIKIWVCQIERKGKVFFRSKDVFTFSLFILLSAAFWFVNALTSKREAEIRLPINYVGVPTDVRFTDELPDEIRLTIRDEGKKLFSYGRKNLQQLTINLASQMRGEDGRVVLYSHELEEMLAVTLLPTTELMSFSPERIQSAFVYLDKKMLPVRLDAELQAAQQYMITQAPEITPDSVEVYGSKKQLAEMDGIDTEWVDLTNLKKSDRFTLSLKRMDEVHYSQTEVSVKVSAEMFTEKTVNLPIMFENVPSDINVRVFPAEIEARFKTPLSQFNHVGAADLEVVFDYSDLDVRNKKYRLVVRNKTPNTITDVRVTPEEIEFILETK